MTTGHKPFAIFPQSDETLTGKDIELASKLSRRIENSQDLSGLHSAYGSVPLEGGGYIYAFNVGGVTKNIVVRGSEPEEVEEEITDYLSIPMLYSGRVVKTVVAAAEPVELCITKGTQKRLVNYSKTVALAPEKQTLMRFVVKLGIYGSEFAPTIETTRVTTQYAQHRPTWFSGSMCKVIQVVTGYGKQKFTEGSEEEIKALTKKEMIRINLPDYVRELIVQELDGYLLMGCTGIPPEDGTIQFDYKWSRSEGIMFSADKKPWIVRISFGEVLAMPLPMIPATTSKAFRAYMELVGDEEIIQILDAFGGMPSGESFPVGPVALQAWKNAGVVIKVCDTADFYSNMALAGSELGWSFSETTNRAAHTCYTFGDDAMQRAMLYQLRMTIGAIKPVKRGDVDADSRNAAWAELAKDADFEKIKWAIAFKMQRSSASGGATFWKNLKIDPISTCTGLVTKTSEGRIWSPAKFEYQPQFKLPSPMIGGCISHDFNPDGNRLRYYPESSQRFDTVVFAWYQGDALKTLRFCNDPRSVPATSTDDFEDCMLVGRWTQVSGTGQTQVYGQFYTSDLDGRKSFANAETTTKIKGEYLGVGKRWGRIVVPFMEGEMTRFHYFMSTTATDSTEGRSLVIGTCVPYLSRNAVLYASSEVAYQQASTWGETKHSIPDAWQYGIWTYSFIAHYVDSPSGVINQLPAPNDAFPVYVCWESHDDTSPCASYVDKGPYARVSEDVTYERIGGWNPLGPL